MMQVFKFQSKEIVMKKNLFILMSKFLLVGSLLFSSQGFAEKENDQHSLRTEWIRSISNQTNDTITKNNLNDSLQDHFNFVSEKYDSEQILNQCEKSLFGIIDGKAYLNPNKLVFIDGHFLLLTDHQQWIRFDQVFKDDFGFYISAKAILCENGHVAFKKVWGTWYCLQEGCNFYYLDHFDY